MRYGQYFKGNEELKTDLSPVIQNKFIKTIRALGTVAIQGFMFFFSLLVFMTILVSIPKNSYSGPVFIVLVFLFFFLYVRYLAYFYGFVGQRWREDAFERWFRAWRMHDLIEYMDLKKILNLKVIDEKKYIFENEMFCKKIKIDYLVRPAAGVSVVPGSPIAITRSEFYKERSHMFCFEFSEPDLNDLKFDISFGDDHGEGFVVSQKDGSGCDALIGEIKDVLSKYPYLRGEIDADKGTLRLVLYDTFMLMSAPGRFPHRAFLKDRHDKAFSGFEEIIRIVCS